MFIHSLNTASTAAHSAPYLFFHQNLTRTLTAKLTPLLLDPNVSGSRLSKVFSFLSRRAARQKWKGVEKARAERRTRSNNRRALITAPPRLPAPLPFPSLPRSRPPKSWPPRCGCDAGFHRFDPFRPLPEFPPPEFGFGVRRGWLHHDVVADGAVAPPLRVAHGAPPPCAAYVSAAARGGFCGGGGGGGGGPRHRRRGERRRLGRWRGRRAQRPRAVPPRDSGRRGGRGGGGASQGGVPLPHQLRPRLRASMGALLRGARGPLHRLRPRRPGRAPAAAAHALVPGPLRRRQAHPPRRPEPHRRRAPAPRRGAARRPRQRLLRAALAELRPAPLLPAPLRRALPSRRRAPQPPHPPAKLHRGAHRRAADAVALRGARGGRHAARGALRAVPHRVPVLHAGATPRRAHRPGAPALAQVPAALPPRDAGLVVLPGGALLPDAARHGRPRRRRAVHAHARQLDRQRRRAPAHVHRAGGDAGAHRRAARVQQHTPVHVRAQVRARMPRPAPGHRGLCHPQGLTEAPVHSCTMIQVSNWVQRRRPKVKLRPFFLHRSSDSSVSLSSCPVVVQCAPSVLCVDLERKEEDDDSNDLMRSGRCCVDRSSDDQKVDRPSLRQVHPSSVCSQ